MLHVLLDAWFGVMPLRLQLLSNACWDSGCSQLGLWFVVAILRGFRLQPLNHRYLRLFSTIISTLISPYKCLSLPVVECGG